MYSSIKVEGGLFAIRVVEEREGRGWTLLISVWPSRSANAAMPRIPMIGRDSGLEDPPRFHSSRPPSLSRIRECRTINDRTSVALVKRQFLLPLETKRTRAREEKKKEEEEGRRR